MVLDYSKWDALELSDDSDVEVHPNVDKRSFIRAKQNQIHQQREQRRYEIQTLKYERIINDGLLSRISKLLGSLRQHEDPSRNPEDLIFQVIMEFTSSPAEDQPPAPPEGVYTQVKEQPKYSQMMSGLVDQVKKEIGKVKSEELFQAYIKGVEGHQGKVQGLQKELLQKLASLEKEEGSKITSEGLHTGFDTSHVAKPGEKTEASSGEKSSSVELLNPGAGSKDAGTSSGDQEEGDDDDPANAKASDLAKRFAKIQQNDYRAQLQFIGDHPNIVAEKETDGLLVEAFDHQMKGNDDYARRCVHHGLLLQYCRSLGRDGVSLFFKRFVHSLSLRKQCKQITNMFSSITTQNHQASTLFRNDVNETYSKIKVRAAELAKDPSASNDPAGVEQIQLHAVEPNTKITINIPPEGSTDPEIVEARNIFESFADDLQKALLSESLDEVNKVLGKMPIEEAEGVVDKLGQGGLLSLEEGIVDATTEEGKKKLEEIEAEGKKDNLVEEVGEPGGDVAELD